MSTPDEELKARPLAEQAVRSLAEQTAELAAERAADKVAKRVLEGIFLHFGVDITDKAQVKALKDNLEFLHRVNRGSMEIKRAAIKTCVGAVVMGLLAILGLGVKDYIINWLK